MYESIVMLKTLAAPPCSIIGLLGGGECSSPGGHQLYVGNAGGYNLIGKVPEESSYYGHLL